tara:strand:+ start:1059 stop:1250 length:192 start_codon:yes stop_codon:yes gene_type:complete
MTTNNIDNKVIKITCRDAYEYVDILESEIKMLIKKDIVGPSLIKHYQDLRDRINIAIHTYHHS